MKIGIGLNIQSPAAISYGVTPDQISGLQLWLKADAGITLASGAVDAWADQSGNVRHAGVTSAANRPAYGVESINGMSVPSFNGSDDHMTILTGLNIARNVPGFSLFFVYKWLANPTSGKYILNISSNVANTRITMGGGETSGKFLAGGRRLDANSYQSIASAGSVNTAAAQIHTAIFDYANSDIFQYINAVLDGTSTSYQTDGNTSDTDSSNFFLGALNTNPSFAANIALAEVVAYNRAVNSTERGQIHAYLASRWGITI